MLRLHDLCHSFASIANDPGVPMFKQGTGPWFHSLHQRRLYPYFRHTHKETIAPGDRGDSEVYKTGKAA